MSRILQQPHWMVDPFKFVEDLPNFPMEDVIDEMIIMGHVQILNHPTIKVMTPVVKDFMRQGNYVAHYDEEYNKKKEERILRESNVEDIPKARWYRRVTFLWTIIGVLLATILSLLALLSKKCI